MNEDSANPVIVPLGETGSLDVGGKAASLGRLLGIGLRVPAGFVVVGAAEGRLPPDLADACARLGGPLAVRSSASGEDGVVTSFAGQYETTLGVEDAEAARAAVERCLASAQSARASAYRDAMGAERQARMAVVVQRMVDARASGVLFTADPVTGARDRVIIDAVLGIGEALVSGKASADHCELARDGRILAREHGGAPAVDEALLARLLEGALFAEERFGHPLDMEWAVGADGELYWLQARPITTLDLPGIDELDTPIDPRGRVFTTYNVAEVLPGAITPLGWSSLGDRMSSAMQSLLSRYGIPEDELAREPMVAQFSSHLFLNMSAMYLTGKYVLGASKEAADISIAGCTLPGEGPGRAPLPVRIANAARYFGTLFGARRRLDAFARAWGSYEVELASDPVAVHRNIDAGLAVVCEAWDVHIHTSSLSGALHGLLLAALSEGGKTGPEQHADVAELIAFVDPADADADASSLGLAQAIDGLAQALSEDPAEAARFAAMTPDEALSYVRDSGPRKVRETFARFVRDHGHRCVRECELRQVDWGEDPRPLIASLQAAVGAPRNAPPARRRDAERVLSALPRARRLVVERLLPTARDAIVLRERSKSLSVKLMRRLRRPYLELARMLVAAGRLPDTDLVFFFLHEELGRLAAGADPALVRRALHRRRLHPQKMALTFPRVSLGKPIPLDPAAEAPSGEGAMRGTPVSRGVVVGRARVARTPEEAASIEPGEILVVTCTDVGWAPHFVRAAGLASEIGSALSHGAVVAREYGLPAVVNLPDATRRFRTGDMVRLDGNTGELARVG